MNGSRFVDTVVKLGAVLLACSVICLLISEMWLASISETVHLPVLGTGLGFALAAGAMVCGAFIAQSFADEDRCADLMIRLGAVLLVCSVACFIISAVFHIPASAMSRMVMLGTGLGFDLSALVIECGMLIALR